MSDKIDLIYDLLKQDREEASDFRREVRQAHEKTDEKLQKIQTETSERLSKIESLDEIQKSQLAEHMRRTDTLEKMYSDSHVRIAKLEEPVKLAKVASKWMLGLGALCGSVLTIFKLLGLF
jgi:hypothetical protein